MEPAVGASAEPEAGNFRDGGLMKHSPHLTSEAFGQAWGPRA